MDFSKATKRLFSSKVLSNGLSSVAIIIFARRVPQSGLGIFFLYQSVLSLSVIGIDFGIRGAIEKRLSEGRTDVLSTAVVMKSIPIAVMFLVILALSHYINRYFGAEIALLLAVGITIEETANLTITIWRGSHRVGEMANIQALRTVVYVLVSIVLLWTTSLEYKAIVVGYLLGATTLVVIGLSQIDINISRPSRKDLSAIVSFSKSKFVSNLGGVVYNWMDIILISYFLTQSLVASYRIAWQVSVVVLVFSQTLGTSMFPQMSELGANKNYEQIAVRTKEMLPPTMFFIFPALFGSVLFAREILTYVFGTEYGGASVVLILLMLNNVTGAFNIIFARMLHAIDRPGLEARAVGLAAVLNIILNVILIPRFGIVGAAAATTIASVIGDSVVFSYLLGEIDIQIPYKKLTWLLISAVVMYLLLSATTLLVNISSLLHLLLAITVGAVIYTLIVSIYRPVREDLAVFIPLPT